MQIYKHVQDNYRLNEENYGHHVGKTQDNSHG